MAVKKSKPAEAPAPKAAAPAKVKSKAAGESKVEAKAPAAPASSATASKAQTPKPSATSPAKAPAAAAAAPAPKKAAAASIKLTPNQLEFLKSIQGAEAGYLAAKKAEGKTIEKLETHKLIKKGSKDKDSGNYRYMVSKAGEKFLSSLPPA